MFDQFHLYFCTLYLPISLVRRVVFVFCFTVRCGCSARIVHLGYNEIEVPTVAQYDVSFVISWLATCLFFTYVPCICLLACVFLALIISSFSAFTVVLASWVQVLRQDFALSGSFTQTLNFAFIGTNLVVYLFYLAMMIVFFASKCLLLSCFRPLVSQFTVCCSSACKLHVSNHDVWPNSAAGPLCFSFCFNFSAADIINYLLCVFVFVSLHWQTALHHGLCVRPLGTRARHVKNHAQNCAVDRRNCHLLSDQVYCQRTTLCKFVCFMFVMSCLLHDFTVVFVCVV